MSAPEFCFLQMAGCLSLVQLIQLGFELCGTYAVDPDRQDSDARRRSTLIALGYTVVTVTRGQVMDAGAFNRLAHQLAKQTGKRLRYSDPDFTRKHRALRSELLQTFALKEDAR